MRLAKHLATSIKDKIDSLSFNGSEFYGDRIDEIISVLGEFHSVIRGGGVIDDKMLKRLSCFDEDEDIKSIMRGLNGVRKIKENDDKIKNLERKILLKWMNTFNEKAFIVFSFLLLLMFSGNFQWLDLDYKVRMEQLLGLYTPLSLLLISIFSGGGKVFDYISWTVVSLFIKDEIRAGKFVRMSSFEFCVIKITPPSLIVSGVSSYFISMVDLSKFDFFDIIIVSVYLFLFALSILNKVRNEKTQKVINSIANENINIEKSRF